MWCLSDHLLAGFKFALLYTWVFFRFNKFTIGPSSYPKTKRLTFRHEVVWTARVYHLIFIYIFIMCTYYIMFHHVSPCYIFVQCDNAVSWDVSWTHCIPVESLVQVGHLGMWFDHRWLRTHQRQRWRHRWDGPFQSWGMAWRGKQGTGRRYAKICEDMRRWWFARLSIIKLQCWQ